MKLFPLSILPILGLLVSNAFALHTAECTKHQLRNVPSWQVYNPFGTGVLSHTRTNEQNAARWHARATKECCETFKKTNAVSFSESSGKCEDPSDNADGIDLDNFKDCCKYQDMDFKRDDLEEHW